MPHVIITDPPDLRDYYQQFRPWQDALEDGTRLATRAIYLRGDAEAVLVDGFCLELGPPTHFFVSIETKKQQITVRLHPHPSPPRTPGVKAVLVRVARDLLQLGGRVDRTNLDL